ncbi:MULTISPECIES: PIG-L deacetylase family protein [unclassified Pseudomonas]|uniref:PIG-L deacetylase family protein n=1 Tax=unclassified Pseudomonas TaxID=196821 RepID=UPI000A1E2F9A|nr:MULTISPECIES: PIG-L family deacetylase [unclassified Pseudomonas]
MSADPISGEGTSPEAWLASRRLAQVASVQAQALVPTGSRAVIVAPHPDDEVLGCGGLLQTLARAGRHILLVSVTDGEASHPGSRWWTPQRLRATRRQECAQALTRLGVPHERMTWLHGGFPDTAVARHEQALTNVLLDCLRPGDTVFTTWRHDGHCDHEAVGRASAAATRQIGARLLEVPIWAWHWASAQDPRIPWRRARKVLMDEAALARKRHAVQAFVSQTEPDPASGNPPVLTPRTLARLLHDFEVVFL